MQKPLPISPCSSHSIPSQSEIESKTLQNRDVTQCTPPVAISTPSPPTHSFPQSAAPSFSHYTHSTRNSPPLTLLPILQHLSLTNDPILHSSHPHSKNHKSNHLFKLPIQLPLSNLLYPPSNAHSTITSHLLPITKPPISPSPTRSHKLTTPFLSHSPIHL